MGAAALLVGSVAASAQTSVDEENHYSSDRRGAIRTTI
jgi:hypothetical protein